MVALTNFSTGAAESQQASSSLYPIEPMRSENDHRDYRVIQLDNGLRAVLVHDTKASNSAASLNIDVGQYDDPVQWDGMAHFLEHMLFLGTEKYPETDEYKNFIDRNAGGSNAYTADDHTNFYFSIRHDAFEEGLDRFSRFFIDPLFDAHYTDRERHAIQSEYNTRKSSTMRRVIAALALTLNPEHRGAHYGIGTLESLRDRDDLSARDAVAQFFREHYSSHRMNLSVVSNQPLDTLEQWVRNSFSEVPRRATINRDKNIPIFSEGTLPFKLGVTPIDNKHSVILQFPVPSERMNWLTRPGNYVSHLLGDEGENSLYHYLNEKGWVKSLGASPHGLIDNDDTALYTIQMSLTDEGMAHYQQVINAVFSYVELIKEQGLAPWRFDEIKRTTQFSFDLFQSNSSEDLAMYLANNLERTAPSNVIYYPYELGSYDEAIIDNYLSHLTPDNMSVIIASPTIKTDKETPLWEAPYSVKNIDDATLAAYRTPTAIAELKLVEENPYIPQSIEPRNNKNADKPIRLDESELAWYFPITSFPGSKAELNAHFRVDELFVDAPHEAAAQLLVNMVSRSLNTLTYPAVVAGVSARVRLSDRGYDINVAGYAQQQPRLFDLIIEQLFNGDFDEESFEFAKDSAIQQVISWRSETPYQQLFPMLSAIATHDAYLKSERLDALENMQFADFKTYLPDLRAVNSVRYLAVGDVLEEEARTVFNRMRQEIKRPTPLKRLAVHNITDVKDVRWSVENPDSAVLIAVQAPDSTIKSRVAFSLISMLVQPQIYTELRTNQQLGYVVQNTTFPLAGVPHFMTLLQTTEISAEEAVARAQQATIDAIGLIQELDEGIFENAKAGFIAQLRSNPQSLDEVMDRYWYDIVANYPDFNQDELLADAASNMSLDYLKETAAKVTVQFNAPLALMAVGSAHPVSIDGHRFSRERVKALSDYERAAAGE